MIQRQSPQKNLQVKKDIQTAGSNSTATTAATNKVTKKRLFLDNEAKMIDTASLDELEVLDAPQQTFQSSDLINLNRVKNGR